MVSFCKQNMRRGTRFAPAFLAEWDIGNSETLSSFYLFTAAVHSATRGSNYGTAFADFIKAEGLGEVWESPIVKNEAFHTDRWNQIWVWRPDVKAVRAWWDKHNEVKKG